MPAVIRSDNGAPFAAASFCGLSVLSAWWVALGIAIERIPPGQPQHNGRIERMHRTLKAETTAPPARDLHAQQRRFNAFQVEYNTDRPHAALDNALPSTLFHPSPRRFPRMTPQPQYADRWLQREVGVHGHVHFGGRYLQVGTPLVGYRLGFAPVDDGVWAVHFYSRRLGEFDRRDATLTFPGGVRQCASNNHRSAARAQC